MKKKMIKDFTRTSGIPQQLKRHGDDLSDLRVIFLLKVGQHFPELKHFLGAYRKSNSLQFERTELAFHPLISIMNACMVAN